MKQVKGKLSWKMKLNQICRKAIGLCRKSFATAGFFSLFINFLMLVPAIYMLQLYDRVITSGSESTLRYVDVNNGSILITMGALEWVRGHDFNSCRVLGWNYYLMNDYLA